MITAEEVSFLFRSYKKKYFPFLWEAIRYTDGELLVRRIRGKSPYRKKQVLQFFAEGWGDVVVVDRIQRGSPAPEVIPESEQRAYQIQIRPAKSGKFAKPVVIRAVRMEGK